MLKPPSDNIINYRFLSTELNVRLMGGGCIWGHIEVSDGHQVGAVCGEDWDKHAINVACRQMGLVSGYRVYLVDTPLIVWKTLLMDHVHCVGNEPNIGWCLHTPLRPHKCPRDQEVVILCVDVTGMNTVTPIFDIRLL